VLFVGAAGYYLLGEGRWNFDDCLYMTAITLSTVGYGEVLPVAEAAGGRIYTIVLIVFGMGSIVYFASAVVALVVEGEIQQYFRRKRMISDIQKLNDHVIVCGAGATGLAIIRDLQANKKSFVVVDQSEKRLRQIMEEAGVFPHIVGDAGQDSVLEAAGINSARGLLAALPEDKDNLFLVMSARQLNPRLRIVSRGIEASIAAKLKKAGADAVVSPGAIGGMRMAAEMLRPKAVEFLESLIRDRERNLQLEELPVAPESFCADRPLGQAGLRDAAHVLILAAKSQDGRYTHNPSLDFRLTAGTILVVLGTPGEIEKLRGAM